MEGLKRTQAQIFAHAVSEIWDSLPATNEQEYGPATEAKAVETIRMAAESDSVKAAGIALSEEQRSDFEGQFEVYLEASTGDTSRMEDELAELFAAD